MAKKKIDLCIGIFDNLSEKGIEKIKQDIDNSEVYGIGVYSDDVVVNDFYTFPRNDLEKRMNTAKSIEGVDFVFPLNTSDPIKLKEIVKRETMNFFKEN